MPDNDGISERIDLLAAVVLHTLVAGRARAFEPICREVERDPSKPAERSEVEQALAVLVADKLAVHEGEQWTPTRAAVRAAELSF
jgi:hypothetical protein